ncbi:MAG: hypothetical protein KDC95_05980 [Planctomycetes bacterium]|nr:hypothetical protein [Planctomycetota bacterium]
MTTIHDFGLRGYDGDRVGVRERILAITTTEIRRIFSKKMFLVFFFLMMAPAIMAFVIVWIRFIVIEGSGQLMGFGNRMERMAARGPFGGSILDVDFYFDLLRGGGTALTLIFSGVVGAGIIARDRAAGALELYFTRGIRPISYFLGKFLTVWFLLLCQVLFGFLIVWIFAVSVAPTDSGYFSETWPFIPRLIAAQAFFCATLAFWLCALSTSTDSVRFAILRWIGVLAVLRIVAGILNKLFMTPSTHLVSPHQVVKRIAQAIAGAEPSDMSLESSILVWGVLCALALYWTRRHLRPVEIVG